MKNLIIILVFVLVNFSCSDQSNIVNNQGSGKILLKIDRANAPSSVVYVSATLTRDAYPPITSTLNLLSDSTADLLLNDIQAGIWHLKVDAMNDSMVVLYTGETDVNILAGFTVNVNLSLQPTGQGTGSIYIYVTWGTQNTNFTYVDYSNNPIISGGNNNYDYYGVSQPVIIFDEGKYKMWYYGDGGSAKKYVLYAESTDGINWIKNPNPVLLPGPQGNWDSWAVQAAAVLKENNTYKMYYTAFAYQYGPWYIGLATSVDGINWTKKTNPVFYSGTGWETQIAAGSVIKINGKYYLYYTGVNSQSYRIGLAISDDGENFTRFSGNPILNITQSWENSGVCVPHVFMENNIYKMIYMNAANTAFGLAYSNDGKTWNKENLNPIFTTNQTTNGWADVSIAYPRYIKVNNEVRIYYGGSKNAPPNVYHKIGFFKRLN
ncbi:hypothetical protein [Ignavibacterium album]|uniref:glycoside hydrolase family 130 protein n=1 Tax=Ignavibacterium album TaxID=591197 RepID=UPI0035B6ADC5